MCGTQLNVFNIAEVIVRNLNPDNIIYVRLVCLEVWEERCLRNSILRWKYREHNHIPI